MKICVVHSEETNSDLPGLVLARTTCICLEFWLVHWNVCVFFEWAEWLSIKWKADCLFYLRLIVEFTQIWLSECSLTREDERLGSGYPNTQTFLLFLFVLFAKQLPLLVARITFFLFPDPFECNCCALRWPGCSLILPVTFCLELFKKISQNFAFFFCLELFFALHLGIIRLLG